MASRELTDGGKLRVLVIEDSADDAELNLLELRRGGIPVEAQRVFTREATREALSGQDWDLVLSDHSMPGFSSHEVLELMGELDIDAPCIIVSGAVGEETAVQLLQDGAYNYVNKNRLYRLVPAVRRALQEVEARRSAAAAEAALRESERKLRELNDTLEQRVEQRTRELTAQNNLIEAALNTLKDVFYILDEDLRLIRWNHQLNASSELDDAQIEGRRLTAFVQPEDHAALDAWLKAVSENGSATTELRFRSSGEYQPYEFSAAALLDASGTFSGLCGIAYNVSARRQTEFQLKEAIRAVIEDATWFAQSVMEKMDQVSAGAGGPVPTGTDLTPREREVLELIARGSSNSQIAEELGLSYPTIRNYVARLYEKLEVNSRAQAVVWARERGFGQEQV
jgi:PAS domain S-box-containing protein